MKTASSETRWSAVCIRARSSLLLLLRTCDPSTSLGADPLPSWNDGAAKKSIVDFVAKVTKEGSAGLRAAR